jgi:hypothetical protein
MEGNKTAKQTWQWHWSGHRLCTLHSGRYRRVSKTVAALRRNGIAHHSRVITWRERESKHVIIEGAATDCWRRDIGVGLVLSQH